MGNKVRWVGLANPSVDLDNVGMMMLNAILDEGNSYVAAKLSLARSELHINPKRYIEWVVREQKFSGGDRIQRIKAVRYLGLRYTLEDAKRYVEELY